MSTSANYHDFMSCQLDKINREVLSRSDEDIMTWISDNSSIFRNEWENSICKNCKSLKNCGYRALKQCDKFVRKGEMKRACVQSGGGCKGIIPLYSLYKIEQEFGPLYEYYELLAGSSVGAINMALIATGKISVKELINIYPDMIKKVFKKKGLFSIPIYDRSNFIKLWDEIVGVNFKMKECKTKLQITSVNLMTQRNHFFKSWEGKDGEERLLEIVLRSFAAPLYFGALVDEKNKSVWFDGGMGNSNLPIDNAFIECKYNFKWDEFEIDAFGCGYKDDSIPFEKAKKYNTTKQLKQFFDIKDGGLSRAQSAFEQVSKIKFIAEKDEKISFKYWDIVIPEKIDTLDGVKFVEEYIQYGIKMSEKPMIEIN